MIIHLSSFPLIIIIYFEHTCFISFLFIPFLIFINHFSFLFFFFFFFLFHLVSISILRIHRPFLLDDSIELWRARIGSYRGCKRIHNFLTCLLKCLIWLHPFPIQSFLVASSPYCSLLVALRSILDPSLQLMISPKNEVIFTCNVITKEFILLFLELPAEIKSFIEALLSTNQPIEQLFQSLSVSTTSASSIWGSICKKVYSCNKPDKRHCLYLKWKNNSYNIRNTVRDSLNTFNPVISRPCPEEQFHVSFNLTNIVVEKRASLVTATLAKDIKSSLVACSDSSSFLFDNVNLGTLNLTCLMINFLLCGHLHLSI